jgi:hypothetical protein
MAMTRPLILFSHGAGASSQSEWMRGWASRLAAIGEVVTFDYPYMRAGRRSPDRQPVLLEAHRAAYDEARSTHPGPVVLAGKSMGSRISCHLALEVEVEAVAVVCLGYPLCNPTGVLRDAVLRELGRPVLFIQGTRDRLCPLDELERVREQMRVPTALHVVESGDHSLLASRTWLKAEGLDQAAVDKRVLEAVRLFLTARARAGSEAQGH